MGLRDTLRHLRDGDPPDVEYAVDPEEYPGDDPKTIPPDEGDEDSRLADADALRRLGGGPRGS